ncbi:MAG: beta-propeller fold lactonase family protein [Planctomycetota bacterium]|nr:beta-propeller fold lactonase family protein [Planctomycetota bacterium]MDA0921794.1 beta-propeller fold lactonase family protein [Planctomycetota bacterium]
MKLTLLTILLGFGMSAASFGADAFRVYAPSSKTHTLWIVDAVPKADGGLELKVAEQPDLGFNGQVFATHPKKPLLYVAGGSGERGKVPGAVVTLARNGGYASHQRVDLNDDAAYLSLDRNGEFLFGVSYGNGRLNVYRLGEDGLPGKAVATIDEGKKEAHCVLISPDNQFLYIPYVKSNLALFQYRFDASTGAVTPLDPHNADPPQGTGPRHLVYHPTLPTVYFTNEQGIGLSTYQRSPDGQLVLKQDIAILPDGMSKDGLSASDLEITPDGKFIFAGLRGHSQNFDRIARYRVREDGQAELLGLTTADKIPWGLTLSPDGNYLLVSAYNGATLTAYRITTQGDLEKVASLPWDAQISDLLTLPANQDATLDLSRITSRTDLDAVIAATSDAALKKALAEHADAILAAAERHPHVEAVVRTIESAPGTFTKINTTPDALNKAAGGDIRIFDTLTQIDTRIAGGKAHDHRKENEDPYDAAFIEHLGHIRSLESVKLEASGIQDSWVAPLLKLKNLKNLSVSGFGRLGDASLAQLQGLTECPDLTHLELAYFGAATDVGWEQLAGLTNLEFFSPRGARFPGHCFARFKGWTRLRNINFHSNGLTDEGFGYVCENFPNLEFIKLWHSKNITDASAEHLRKLKKLKGMEISCSQASAALVKHLDQLPIEYVALEYGVNSPASDAIATIKSIPTLRRFKLGGATLAEPDLVALAGAAQLEELSVGTLDLPDERLSQLQAFSFLKSLRLVPDRKNPFSPENQAKLKALLSQTSLEFQ